MSGRLEPGVAQAGQQVGAGTPEHKPQGQHAKRDVDGLLHIGRARAGVVLHRAHLAQKSMPLRAERRTVVNSLLEDHPVMRKVARTDRGVKMASVTSKVRYFRSSSRAARRKARLDSSASQPLRGRTRSVPERLTHRRADPCCSVPGGAESR